MGGGPEREDPQRSASRDVRPVLPDDGEADPAVYEFYNVFPGGTLQAGNSYDVTVQAFDRKGAPIEGMTTAFRIAS